MQSSISILYGWMEQELGAKLLEHDFEPQTSTFHSSTYSYWSPIGFFSGVAQSLVSVMTSDML